MEKHKFKPQNPRTLNEFFVGLPRCLECLIADGSTKYEDNPIHAVAEGKPDVNEQMLEALISARAVIKSLDAYNMYLPVRKLMDDAIASAGAQ